MKKYFCVAVALLALASLGAQALNEYRSVSSGNWDSLASWEYWNGTAWASPTVRPTSASNVITIRSPHVVTVTTNVAVDQVTVASGATVAVSSGTLSISNGALTPDMWVFGIIRLTSTGAVSSSSSTLWIDGSCEYNRNGGNIPLASWHSGSTLEINGLTTSLPGNRTQTLQNLTWNCTGQTANLNPTGTSFRVINGLFKVISTGTGILTWTSTNTNTKTLGAWEQTGGTVRMSDGASAIRVMLNGNFTMSGGTLTETGSATGCAWIFQGAGYQTFYKTGGTISQTISFTVNNGSTMDIVDQALSSSGSFTLSYGGALQTHSPEGISLSGTSGAIQVSGSRSYSPGGFYHFVSTSPQVTGSGLPASIAGLTIDNPSGVTLSNPVQVFGTTNIIAGNIYGSFDTDGFSAPQTHYLEIIESGELISGLNIAVSTPTLYTDYINRSWNLAGNFSGIKTVVFWWDAMDDLECDWEDMCWAPAAFNGLQMYQGGYDVSSDPRWLTIDVESTLSDAPWVIGRDDEQTLPVELSSFTATSTAENTVLLTWITQSESNTAGFGVYRSQVNDLEDALLISERIDATNTSAQAVYRFDDSEVEAGLWYYWLETTDLGGHATFHGPISYSVTLPIDDSMPPIPIYTKLQKVFPNPFNPQVNVTYSIADPVAVNFLIYNLRGQLVQSFDQGFKGTGYYHLSWDGKDAKGSTCTTGVYLIKMIAGEVVSTRKAVMTK